MRSAQRPRLPGSPDRTYFSPVPQPVYADYHVAGGRIVARGGIRREYDPLAEVEVLVDLAAIQEEGRPLYRSLANFAKRYGLLEGADQEPEVSFWAHMGSVRDVLQLGYYLQEGKTAPIVEALSVHRPGGTGDVVLSFAAGLTSSGEVAPRRKRIPWSDDDVPSVARQVIAAIINENLQGLTYVLDPDTFAVRVAVPTLRHAVYVHLATALAGPLGVCGEGKPEKGCQGIYPAPYQHQVFCSLRCGDRFRKRGQRKGNKQVPAEGGRPAVREGRQRRQPRRG